MEQLLHYSASDRIMLITHITLSVVVIFLLVLALIKNRRIRAVEKQMKAFNAQAENISLAINKFRNEMKEFIGEQRGAIHEQDKMLVHRFTQIDKRILQIQQEIWGHRPDDKREK